MTARASKLAQKPYQLEQAAELAGCSVRTLQRAIKDGDLAAYRPGARVIIYPDDFRAWIESRRIRPVIRRGGKRRPLPPIQQPY